MRAFTYERPTHLADAVGLLAASDGEARLLAGGTDLIIRLRDGSIRPRVVVDVKGIEELDGEIREADGGLRIGARTVMTDIAADERIRDEYEALAEAASVVGSVQIRNRATLAGNICNASPAADTAPSLLVYGAQVVVAGPAGTRRIPIDDFFVRSGVTTLERGEIVSAIELPRPATPRGSVHVRRTRRRGHDLASVTLTCAVQADGTTRIAYGSLGPRPLLVTDESGVLADPSAPDLSKMQLLETLFVGASPSARSMRASPEYRLAMLHVLGLRAVGTAIERLARGGVPR
jgi:carbon-monoxide dehydrogenase medium subunit